MKRFVSQNTRLTANLPEGAVYIRRLALKTKGLCPNLVPREAHPLRGEKPPQSLQRRTSQSEHDTDQGSRRASASSWLPRVRYGLRRLCAKGDGGLALFRRAYGSVPG